MIEVVRILRFAFLFLFYVQCFGQNLLINGDFELYTSLPTTSGEWSKCLTIYNLNGLVGVANSGSPDYYHLDGTGFGQLPNTGVNKTYPYSQDGVMAFISANHGIEFREYVSLELGEALKPNSEYHVSFWITNGYNCEYGSSCDNTAIVFSTDTIHQLMGEVLELQPHFTIEDELWSSEWVNYQFTFIADSNYRFMTFGNFTPDSLLTHTHQVPGSFDISYYFIDNIEVLCREFSCMNVEIPNVFTPNNDGVNDKFSFDLPDLLEKAEMRILNRWGEEVFYTDDPSVFWDGKFKEKLCTEGNYYWMFNGTDKNGVTIDDSGYFQLIR